MDRKEETKSSLKETALETIQRNLDTSMVLLSNAKVAEAVEVLQAVPVVRVLASGYKVVGYYRSKQFTKKVLSFLEALGNNLDEGKLAKLYSTYGKDDVVEEIVCLLDSYTSADKTSVLGFLINACTEEKITFEEFKALSFALGQLNPAALLAEIKFTNGDDGDLISSATPYLIAVGLANSFSDDKPLTWSGTTGGTRYTVTPLGKKLIDFGIRPYQEQ